MRIDYRYRPRPVPVTFQQRLHRFGATVTDTSGQSRLAHIPNPGRMEELLLEGATGWMVPSVSADRATDGTLVAVRHGRSLISIDTQLPNRIIQSALARPSGLSAWGIPSGPWRSEVTYGSSRLDFGIPGRDPRRPIALLEVKSANLRVGGRGLFPDAPTVRGRRHVEELARAAERGTDSSVLFVVQRGDVPSVEPNRSLDPDFAEACDRAARVGVRFRAVRLRVRREGVELGGPLPVVGISAGRM